MSSTNLYKPSLLQLSLPLFASVPPVGSNDPSGNVRKMNAERPVGNRLAHELGIQRVQRIHHQRLCDIANGKPVATLAMNGRGRAFLPPFQNRRRPSSKRALRRGRT